MEQNSSQERLDVTKIDTVEKLNSTDFSKYIDKHDESWIRYIIFPVSTVALNKICELSTQEGSMFNLGWTMGDLFYKKKALPNTRPFKQRMLPNQE